MKLSEILGRILTDVAFRQSLPDAGVCHLVDVLSGWSSTVERDFDVAKDACRQTDTYVYPVAPANGDTNIRRAYDAWTAGHNGKCMWRGQYGINRRKLVRDCWRWAKERGL